MRLPTALLVLAATVTALAGASERLLLQLEKKDEAQVAVMGEASTVGTYVAQK